ncbi:MAG: ABC transporter ATP-binding protein [Opitutales bacterium]
MSETAARSTVLRIEGLHRFLGEGETRNHVLRGIDLEVHSHRLYSIVGPSGCGKSTLLYLLGLLDRPDQGEIWVGGKNMARASDNDRTAARNAHIGFVFQFHFLLPEFTALENVTLPMRKLGRRSLDECKERAHSLLREVGLDAKAKRLVTRLSGGEQQRVAIARALANEPALLLADEPTGNLDLANSERIFDLLARISHEQGQATVVVTHNPELAETCDAVLPMRDGRFVDAEQPARTESPVA